MYLNEQEVVSLNDLGDYAGKLNKELKEQKLEAVFLFSSKHIDEMLNHYKDCFLYLYNCYLYGMNADAIKRIIPNEVLLEKFIAYISNDVLKVAYNLKTKDKNMTTEEMIDVMKAYTEGKQIQYLFHGTKKWTDLHPGKAIWDWFNNDYRIKPESYRPYKNIDEFRQHYANIKEQVKDEVFDGFWLKSKDPGKRMFLVAEIINEGLKAIRFATIGEAFSLKDVFELFTYPNGTPFGMLDE